MELDQAKQLVRDEVAARQSSAMTARIFLGRHSRLITFLGALIVFATFVAKDGVREEIKGRLDGIHSAETVYEMREDSIKNTGNRLSVAWKEIDGRNPEKMHRAPKKLVEEEAELLDETNDALDSSFSALFALEHAAKEFDDKDVPYLTDEHQRQSEFSDDYETMILGVMSDYDYLQPSPADEHDVKVFRKYEGDGIFFIARNNITGSNIINRIEEKIKKEEGYYKIVTLLSYVLYTVGWALGLLGRMTGVEGDLDTD